MINSCASDPTLGQTVCTANNNDVYVIAGGSFPDFTHILQSSGKGLIGFSGGDCTNCAVAMDPINHWAMIGLSLNGTAGKVNGQPGFQILDLTGPGAPSFEPPVVSPAGNISEAFVFDPQIGLLSASEPWYSGEVGNYEVAEIFALDFMPTLMVFYENPIGSGSGEDGPDASAVDCSSNIAITPMEDSSPTQVYLADLTQADFIPGGSFLSNGTWSDSASQFYTLAGSNLTTYGTTGAHNGPIAVAQGTSHEGVLGQEFPDQDGGNTITAFKLNVPYDATTPFAAWMTCNLGEYFYRWFSVFGGWYEFQQGYDPHTLTAYQSPNLNADGTYHSFAVIANGNFPFWSLHYASELMVVDLDLMLQMSDSKTPHVCDVGTLPRSSPIRRSIELPVPH